MDAMVPAVEACPLLEQSLCIYTTGAVSVGLPYAGAAVRGAGLRPLCGIPRGWPRGAAAERCLCDRMAQEPAARTPTPRQGPHRT